VTLLPIEHRSRHPSQQLSHLHRVQRCLQTRAPAAPGTTGVSDPRPPPPSQCMRTSRELPLEPFPKAMHVRSGGRGGVCTADLVENPNQHDVDGGGVVAVRQPLVQLAHHIHVGLHVRPGGHRTSSGVGAVGRYREVPCDRETSRWRHRTSSPWHGCLAPAEPSCVGRGLSNYFPEHPLAMQERPYRAEMGLSNSVWWTWSDAFVPGTRTYPKLFPLQGGCVKRLLERCVKASTTAQFL